MGAVYIAATVALTVYGQLAFKWRIDEFPCLRSLGLNDRDDPSARD